MRKQSWMTYLFTQSQQLLIVRMGTDRVEIGIVPEPQLHFRADLRNPGGKNVDSPIDLAEQRVGAGGVVLDVRVRPGRSQATVRAIAWPASRSPRNARARRAQACAVRIFRVLSLCLPLAFFTPSRA